MTKQTNPGRGLRGNKLKEYLKTIQLTDIQRDVLIGTLLGDASFSLENRKPKYSVKFEQGQSDPKYGKNHADYINHLFEIFKPLVGTWPVERLVNKKNAELGTEKPRYSLWFRTYQHNSLIFYYNLFYKQEFDPKNSNIVISKVKIVPKNIGKFLTPRAIAYWFMDDGSYEDQTNRTYLFNTQGFTKQESQMLCDILLEKYGIEANTNYDGKSKRIRVKTASAPILRDLIKDYVIPAFYYKL
uniref:Putative site-specific DNA endonuclease n=1 Tax=Stigeoclonium helveticum TaxID=55999 RepID=Q06SK0_STIHE|nr:putative site-specific DNA endonuclease [Stigeoclonium helveticum]ABF60216.1 putative site-specific DNA endonuclease [Stigeoclonium helveticum]